MGGGAARAAVAGARLQAQSQKGTHSVPTFTQQSHDSTSWRRVSVGESSRTGGTLAVIPVEWAGHGEGEYILSLVKEGSEIY